MFASERIPLIGGVAARPGHLHIPIDAAVRGLVCGPPTTTSRDAGDAPTDGLSGGAEDARRGSSGGCSVQARVLAATVAAAALIVVLCIAGGGGGGSASRRPPSALGAEQVVLPNATSGSEPHTDNSSGLGWVPNSGDAAAVVRTMRGFSLVGRCNLNVLSRVSIAWNR
jgi:hypothetical protein